MFASLGRAIDNFLDGTLKGIVLRSIGLTLLLFVVLFALMEIGLHHLPVLGAAWVNRLIEILAPIFAIFGIVALGAPVAAFFASLFLDEVAAKIEARSAMAPGIAPPLSIGLVTGLRLAVLVLLVDLVLLPVNIELPGLAAVATLVANGWLLGREYFELAALRHLSRAGADALRRRHGGRIFAAGTLISVLTMIPAVNLIAPLFGAVFMVHMFQLLSKERSSP